MGVLGKSSTASHKQTSLFDIRLKGTDHDVLIIKGTPHEAPSVLINGTIVLSVLEPMTVRKLTLKLYATLRLKWTNSFETARGTTIRKPYRYERRVFEHSWDNFEIQNYFSNLYDNYNNRSPILTRSSSANSSNSSLTSFGKKTRSATNLVSFGSSASLNQQQNHILLQGNYEFPFSAILPGSTLESVEGLPGASLVYKLQANIERGRFSNDLIAKKHLRIVRTLTPDALELSETMAVDNTWPKKVEYTISIPSRAVAIGSSSPINMLFVPLVKGLKLGKVKVSLVEYYSCSGSFGPPHTGERNITTETIPANHIDISEDKWEINTLAQIPPSLSKCTQDVDILNNIKVRHKLKFVVGLVNPDGHVSELRASLPIILFISPFVALGVRNFDRKDSVADHSTSAFAEIQSDDEPSQADDDVIFSPDPEVIPSLNTSRSNLDLLENERQAPPNYGSHIYDRLWSEIATDETPDTSRAQTPIPGTPSLSATGESLTDSRNIGRLTENLRRLHMQQRMSEQSGASLDQLAMSSTNMSQETSPAEQIDDDEEDSGLSFRAGAGRAGRPAFYIPTPTNELQEGDYFSQPGSNTEELISPGIVSPGPMHISRVNSYANLSSSNASQSPPCKDWDSESMSKVPSYQIAMRSPTPDGISSLHLPAYEEAEMSRPRSIHLKPSSLSNSHAQSTAYFSTLRGREKDTPGKSKTSSTGSSPTISRNQSSGVLSGSTHSKSSSQSNINLTPKSMSTRPKPVSTLSFSGMTPLSSSSESNGASTPPRSLQTVGRSSSLANMMGSLMHKKDKKKAGH